MANPTTAQPNHDRSFLIALAVMFTMLICFATCDAQVIYSSWSSAQVKHAVETEKPVVARDTITTLGLHKIEISFTYKGFKIFIDQGEEIKLRVIAGQTRVMLKPDDEYEVIEKLLNLK